MSRSEIHKVFCPYCNADDVKLRDHVFPQFLGGNKTIPACADCNNRIIGTGIEGPVSKQLAWIPVMIRKVCRIPAPVHSVWENAFTREGIVYDLDTELGAVPHSVEIKRNESGLITRAIYQVRRQVEALLRSKPAVNRSYVVSRPTEKWDLNELQVQFQMSPEQLGLALKLVLTLGCLTDAYRLDLKGASALKSNFLEFAASHVRFDARKHADLNCLRPSLSHSIFLRAGKAPFGIVQLYSCLQFYVSLPASNLSADDVCHLGLLDITSGYSETFARVECKEIRMPEVLTDLTGFTFVMTSFAETLAQLSGNPEIFLKRVQLN